MVYQNKFKRYELKFLLSPAQYSAMQTALYKNDMRLDDYGKTLICNMYYDTPDFLLIRKSLEKPIYKEKLRLRAYASQKNGKSAVLKTDKVFLELKKKFNGVVYKRRKALLLSEVDGFLNGQPRGCCLCDENNYFDKQISAEITQFAKNYASLEPRMYISYMREAYFCDEKENKDLRITFDYNALWRDYDVNLENGAYGFSVLPPEKVLMEVKISGALPLWLTGVLSENGIYKTSFSKYGAAYVKMKNKQIKGEVLYG